MAAGGVPAGLRDIPLPDLDELQIPIDWDFAAFDESGLAGNPPSIILSDGTAAHRSESFDHLSWLHPTTSESNGQASDDALPSGADQQQQTRPTPAERAAGPKGKVERKAEQNRCCNADRLLLHGSAGCYSVAVSSHC